MLLLHLRQVIISFTQMAVQYMCLVRRYLLIVPPQIGVRIRIECMGYRIIAEPYFSLDTKNERNKSYNL